MSLISVIVPCFNEEESIKMFYDEFAVKTARLRRECKFEIIFVDDGSKDNTLREIKNLVKNVSEDMVKYISFSRNFGKEAAIYAGLKESTGDFVTLMDVDLQDPPEMLVEMYDRLLNKKIDCVATRRATRKGEPVLRSMFSRMFYRLINKVSETEIVDGARDFRLMTRKMTDAVLSLSEKNRFSKGLFSWVGFKTEWISYENIERKAGKTKWNFWKLFRYAIEGILGYSDALLMLPAAFAGIFGFSGLILLIFAIVYVNSFIGILAALLFMLSVLCVFFLNMGLYIAKINREVKERPIYIEKEKGGNKS